VNRCYQQRPTLTTTDYKGVEMADSDCTVHADCARCGAHFHYERTGRSRIYCSVECRTAQNLDKAKAERAKSAKPLERKACKHCGLTFTGKANQIYCEPECKNQAKLARVREKMRGKYHLRNQPHKANCLQCGVEFRYGSNKQGMFCSKSCSIRYRHADPDWSKAENARRAKSAIRQKLRLNQGKFSPVYDKTCIHCGKVHHGHETKSGFYCSTECRDKWRLEHKKWEIRMVHGHPLTQIKICPESGWLFKPENNSAMYATKEIGYRVHKRIAKAKRRARKKANGRMENIDPIKVFESVDYKCQICGCQTDPDLRGTIEDQAPELDHIIPLAKGGTHTWGNVQCACRECNRTKSDGLPKKHRVDQLVLHL
jgi:5-methylcytosine-specific restriction endonuclease McrA